MCCIFSLMCMCACIVCLCVCVPVHILEGSHACSLSLSKSTAHNYSVCGQSEHALSSGHFGNA